MELLRDFTKLGKDDVALAGGKGASLGEMTGAGIPVPPGFVILSTAFEKFLEVTDLNVEIDSIFHSVDHKEIHTIENASEKIKALILDAEMPKDIAEEIQKFFKNLDSKYVAVRSSATAEDSASAAWAGQLESYLNTTEENLLENIKKCWASLFTPRAIFYRFEKNLHKQKISVAVVVQKMVESEKSGIAFSVHPVTQDRNQLIIEAGFGLGEAIVSGQITPDSYVVEKQPRRIIDKNVQIQDRGLYRAGKGGNEWRDIPKIQGEKQVLPDREILELSEVVLKIEDHYNFACDVEWAFESGKFYIVQSRPITTLLSEFATGKKKIIGVEELVHLNIPLSLVELHYEQEAAETVPWTKEKFKVKPYIFYKKEGDQVYFYYDPMGINWQMKHAGRYKNENNAIENINIYFNKVGGILKQEKGLGKKEFLQFLADIRNLWPWMNYMWWAIEYKEKNKKSFGSLLSVRKQTEYFTPGLIAVLRNSIRVIFPDKKKYADVLLLNEVESGKVPNKSILEKRLKSFAYTNYKLFKSWNDLVDEFDVRIKQKVIGDWKNMIGQTAYPGYVKGRVKIISDRKGVEKFEKGEILVASTTTPDYLPAMKKSSAIISEHGGAICHAAITSRELKIPCVVGVSGATKILKNGDMIEVNATDGIIKVLK